MNNLPTVRWTYATTRNFANYSLMCHVRERTRAFDALLELRFASKDYQRDWLRTRARNAGAEARSHWADYLRYTAKQESA